MNSTDLQDLLLHNDIIPNSTVYLISSSWLEQFRLSLQKNLLDPIPPISNESILSNNEVIPGLSEHKDYEILSESVWNSLFHLYGGGPPIPRIVEIDPKTNLPNVLIYPPKFPVYYREQRRIFSFSLHQPISSFKEKLCSAFDISSENSRICDFEGRKRQRALDDTRTLASYDIGPNHQLLIETRVGDETWVTVTHVVPQMSTSPSMNTIASAQADPGLCGLINPGSLCYLNSVLQVLTHTPPLIDFFLTNNWISALPGDISEAPAASAFATLMKDIWSGDNTEISTKPIFKLLFSHHPSFKKERQQQDAHECLTLLLDLIHSDLNKIRDCPHFDPLFGDSKNDEEISRLSWEHHIAQNNSYIVELFHGLFKSTCKCPNCNSITTVFDPFQTLSIPVPLPRIPSPEFIFVPWDLTSPRMKMTVSLFQHPSSSETVEAITKAIGREFRTIFAERVRGESLLKWRTTLTQSTKNSTLYAFEVPQPKTPSSVFAPCRLFGTISSILGKIQKELDDFFLVELPSPEASISEIKEACYSRTTPFYDFSTLQSQHNEKISFSSDQHQTFNENFQRIQNKIVDNNEFFEGDEKMKINIKGGTILRERHFPLVTSNPIEILLHSEIRDSSKFRWDLIGNIQQKQTTKEAEKKSDKIDLDYCLKLFTKERLLSPKNKWICPHCSKAVCASKTIGIWQAPPILIVHLKRFRTNNQNDPIKLGVHIDFPDVLDLKSYILNPEIDANETQTTYKLFAVIDHQGEASGGHYTAYAIHSKKNKWYFFNDSSIKLSRASAAHNKLGYILLYMRIDKFPQ